MTGSVQDRRVERAVHLLRTGTESIDRIAAQIGDSDGVSLRALWRRKLGRGVRELRAPDSAAGGYTGPCIRNGTLRDADLRSQGPLQAEKFAIQAAGNAKPRGL